MTPACRDLATALYATIVDEVVPVSSPVVAEMAKLLENTFRQINVAFANEMALICERLGVDVWEVIDAAATKPFGFMPFYPGPGLGGPCIPVVPHYLAWKLKTLGYDARFIALAEEINAAMPAHVVDLVADALNDEAKPLRGSRVLVLGITYKPDVADTRESPPLAVLERLLAKGADAVYHDPFVPEVAVNGRLAGERHARRSSVARGRLCRRRHRSPLVRLGLDRRARAPHRRHPQRDRRRCPPIGVLVALGSSSWERRPSTGRTGSRLVVLALRCEHTGARGSGNGEPATWLDHRRRRVSSVRISSTRFWRAETASSGSTTSPPAACKTSSISSITPGSTSRAPASATRSSSTG